MSRFVPNPAAPSKARPPVTTRRLHKFIYVMNTMSKPDEAIAAREAGFGLSELGEPDVFKSQLSRTIRVWSRLTCLGSNWLVEVDGTYAILLNPFAMPNGYTLESKK